MPRSSSVGPDWSPPDAQAGRDKRRRRILLIAAGLLLFWLFVAMFSMTSSAPPGSGGNRQQDYIEELDKARQQLFRAKLEYPDAGGLGLTAEETVVFRATVKAGWHPARETAGTGTGKEVRAGGKIGMQLHCSGAGVTCVALSSKHQNVLKENDRADWTWQVTPKKSGTVSLALTMTAYYQNTNTVLFEKSVTDSATVTTADDDSGPLSWTATVLGWVEGLISNAGALAASLGAVVALVLAVKTWRRPGGGPPDGSDGT